MELLEQCQAELSALAEQLKDNQKHSQTLLEQKIEKSFEQMMARFDDKLAYDKTKQQQIDKLHEELQTYKIDLIAKTCRPLINGIIRLYHNIGKTTENLNNKQPEQLTPQLFFKLIDDIQDDVQVLLEQHGVDCFIEPSDEFNPRRQRALNKYPVEDEAMHGKILDRIRPGFEYASEILQKELINIAYYQPSTEITDDSDISINAKNTNDSAEESQAVSESAVIEGSELTEEQQSKPEIATEHQLHPED